MGIKVGKKNLFGGSEIPLSQFKPITTIFKLHTKIRIFKNRVPVHYQFILPLLSQENLFV